MAGVPLRGAAAMESQVRLFLLDSLAWSRGGELAVRAHEVARWARREGLLRAELEAWHRMTLAAHLEGRPADPAPRDRMRELAASMAGAPRPQALLAHAEAMIDGDLPFVQVAARELARLGLWLPSAAPGVGLTRREREIAGLAAGGLSSKEIGERLTLSVRTVDSHLSRVFAKLGVRSRHELGALVRPAGGAPRSS
ncbi:MAG: helix-turn-helix transcriptional regulator [Kineosporiaceae bacterium]